MRKTSRKILSFLLVVMLMLSVIPMTTLAAGFEGYTRREITRDFTTYYFEDGVYVTIHNASGKVVASTHDRYEVQLLINGVKDVDRDQVIHADDAHDYVYGLEISRGGHYTACSCGALQGHIVPHIDPKDAVDGRCTCGYKFMTNADLTTLWLSDVKLSPSFNRNTTEYKAELVNDDVTALDISAFSFDANADVEISGDLELKDGTNTITVKVTAEDTTTTKTYTITVEK